ncbi:hypothetical protein FHS95_000394 [Sphingomonas naasensis]|uniref:Uncharacterized protein n=1 Tax=Sphingomonas naasensis TaxID=1344951 RepID=A0A4S1WRF9_9SPHN|nr:hypothetical protein [Sphingomonas naasensis]NIJ18725.1 hypothetical protein [Sphingomonas naasensis]TGX45961.1 hypothetical protein E5A74_01950 [Sphingomonas naasensis]
MNYRLDVEVDDNGVIRTGSRVWSFELARPIVPLVSSFSPRFRGEAVPVELPGRGTLFALVVGRTENNLVSLDAMAMLPERVLQPQWPNRNPDRILGLAEIATRRGQSRVLNCGREDALVCPYLVSFADINDPRTVVPLAPDDLEAHFGKGVRLRKISVTVTHQPVEFSSSAPYPVYSNRPDWAAWVREFPSYDVRTIGPEAFRRER